MVALLPLPARPPGTHVRTNGVSRLSSALRDPVCRLVALRDGTLGPYICRQSVLADGIGEGGWRSNGSQQGGFEAASRSHLDEVAMKASMPEKQCAVKWRPNSLFNGAAP